MATTPNITVWKATEGATEHGLYTTEAAARAHLEHLIRQTDPDLTIVWECNDCDEYDNCRNCIYGRPTVRVAHWSGYSGVHPVDGWYCAEPVTAQAAFDPATLTEAATT